MSVILFLLACGVKPVPREADGPAVDYAVTLDLAVATTAADAAGSPLAAIAPLADLRQRYTFDLRLAGARTYRDGSEGLLLRFVDGSLLEGEGSAPQVPSLVGRSVELRRFPDGELLRIDLLDHVAGGDRHGELLDPLYFALSPRPPDLPAPGATDRRTARWPLFLDRDRGLWTTVSADWTLAGTERIADDRVWKIDYQGIWTTEGGDRSHGPPIAAKGEGTVQGTVWLSQSDHGLVRHTLRWSRTLTLTYDGAPAGPVTVVQRQAYEATVERRP